MQAAFQELRETAFKEVALGNVDKFRNYSTQKSFSVDPVACAAQAPSGVLLVDPERYRGRRFLHWHKVDGGVALTEIALDTDLDNNFLVVLLDKRSATDEVWLYLSESSHAENGQEVERLLCIATAGGAFYQLPLLATGEASMLASSTIQHSVRRHAKEMHNVAMANFAQLEDNINEIVWVSYHQAAVAAKDGFVYVAEMRGDGQWRLKKFVSKQSLWLVEALVPEAPSAVVLGLAGVSLSDQLEKLLSIDEAGVVKMWDFHSRSLQSQFNLRQHLFPEEEESAEGVTLQKGLIRVFLRDHGRFIVVVAVSYPVHTTLSSSVVVLSGDVHTGTLGAEAHFLEQDWEGWVPNDVAVLDRFTVSVAWKCGRAKERLTTYFIDSEPESVKHPSFFRELDDQLKTDVQSRAYMSIPERLSHQSASIQTRWLLRRLLDETRFDWDVVQHVCSGLIGREDKPVRTRSQLAHLVVASVDSWPDEDWQQRAAELDLISEDTEIDDAEAVHLKFAVLTHLCTERQKDASSRVSLRAVVGSLTEDRQQLFSLVLTRGNRLSLLLPSVSAIELVDMETEQFSFPTLKSLVLQLLAVVQEFCSHVAPDAFCLPFELGYRPQQLLEAIESNVSEMVRQLGTRSDTVQSIREIVQALSTAELQVVFSKLVGMLAMETDRSAFVSALPPSDDSQSFEARQAQFPLHGQAAAHMLAAQTRAVLRDQFTVALSVCCVLSALAQLGARVVPSVLGGTLRSTFVPSALCNLASAAFLVWASETTCATHAIHDTPLRSFEKEPGVVPNMLAVLMEDNLANAKLGARSETFERWYRSISFMTAFWAYMGPSVQDFWGSHPVHREELLVGRWAHVLLACMTALRPTLDSELCVFLEMTAQYSVLSRLCSLRELKVSIARRAPADAHANVTALSVIEARVLMLASMCTLAEAVEVKHSSARGQHDGKGSTVSEGAQLRLKQLLEDACDEMLTSANRLALLDNDFWVDGFLARDEAEVQLRPAEMFKDLVDQNLSVEVAYTLTRLAYETRTNPRLKMLQDKAAYGEAIEIPESWVTVAFIQKLHVLALFDRSRSILGAVGAELALRCAYEAIGDCEALFPEVQERLDSLWSKAADFALQVHGRMDEAYAAIVNIREPQRQKESVRALVTHVCDNGLLHWLIALPYSDSGIASTVESELRLLATKNDVHAVVRGERLDYNDCLFAYLCAQRQFLKAAKWMYELNMKVEQVGAAAAATLETRSKVLEARVRLLAKAISTLELLPPLEQLLKVDNVVSEVVPTAPVFSRKRPLFDVDNVVDIKTMRAEFVKVLTALDLLKSQYYAGDADGLQQLQALIESGRFDAAYSFAKAAGLDASIVVEQLASHCCLEDNNGCQTGASTFADVDASYGPRKAKHSHERCWDVLQDILARETAEQNFHLHAVAVEALLSYSPADKRIPTWLVSSFAGHALERKASCTFESCNGNATKLLRLLVRYDRLAEACDFAVQVMESADRMGLSNPKRGQVDWLPYNDFDTLLGACKARVRRQPAATDASLEASFKRFEQALAEHVNHSLVNEYGGQVARW